MSSEACASIESSTTNTTSGALHQPDRNCRLVLALRRPGLDLPVPDVVFVVEDSMDAHASDDISKHVKTYFMVFGALMVLTIVTVAVSYLHLPVHQAIIVALAIATVKGSMVALFFMHLNHERKLIYWVLALT